MSVATGLLAAAVGVFVIVRQVLPRRLSWKLLAVMPIVFAYLAWRSLPAGPVTARQGFDLALEIALGLVCGLWQASATRVFARGGQWYLRGGWAYLAGWIVFLAARIGLGLALQGHAALAGGNSWVLLIGAAAVWGARALGLYLLHPELAAAPEAA
jgi:hypothetical protein